jgi:hypothetical protein
MAAGSVARGARFALNLRRSAHTQSTAHPNTLRLANSCILSAAVKRLDVTADISIGQRRPRSGSEKD